MTLALARASALDAKTLARALARSHAQLEGPALDGDVAAMLTHGLAACVFGAVNPPAAPGAGRRVPFRWFYCPDSDDDRERAAVIAAPAEAVPLAVAREGEPVGWLGRALSVLRGRACRTPPEPRPAADVGNAQGRWTW
jgi:hypothetical protein